MVDNVPSQRHSRADLLIGLSLAAGGAVGTLVWMGPATAMLSVGLVVSFLVWSTRRPASAMPGRLLWVYAAGIFVLCLHCSEECLAGFQREFPRFFGYVWSNRQFLEFNLLWIVLFVLAGLAVYRRISVGYLFIWFLALAAGIGNGIGHLLLSLAQGRYFPGTATAPLCLIVGLAVLRELLRLDSSNVMTDV